MSDLERDYYPYFSQLEPDIQVDGMIADLDISESYELNAAAVFKAGHRYLIVFVSGCSCWPDLGHTIQRICNTKSEADKLLRDEWSPLLQKCQDVNWEVQDRGTR